MDNGAEAVWDGIVSREEHDAVTVILTDPSRLTHGGVSRKLVGSGIYVCGGCGRKMRSHARQPIGSAMARQVLGLDQGRARRSTNSRGIVSEQSSIGGDRQQIGPAPYHCRCARHRTTRVGGRTI